MDRFLVLFAREPARQAREKGLRTPEAEGLFQEIAKGWARAARLAGANLVLATPEEDRAAWARSLGDTRDLSWIAQRGSSLGERLEDAARRAATLGGRAVFVGGDVAPSLAVLLEAFDAIEGGSEAAVAPAPDGGFSLLAVGPTDADLLRAVRPRRRNILRDLLRALHRRGRRVRVVSSAADVDGRSSLRRLLRGGDVPALLLSLARRALIRSPAFPETSYRPLSLLFLHGSPVLRGPPLPA
jgi:glycosyltransferase A (GT-A) superfamily protein (DUF2064 family)